MLLVIVAWWLGTDQTAGIDDGVQQSSRLEEFRAEEQRQTLPNLVRVVVSADGRIDAGEEVQQLVDLGQVDVAAEPKAVIVVVELGRQYQRQLPLLKGILSP